MEHDLGLTQSCVYCEHRPNRISSLPPFYWDARLERSQAIRYLPHLEKIQKSQQLMMIDAANEYPNLLSGQVGGYAVWGTISVAVIYRCGRIHPTASLQCIFHLKKNEVGQGRCQILVALVMANILSTQFQPFAILTDLMDDWILYWMDGSKICFFRFESRADGVSTIEDFLGGHEIEAPAGKDLLVSHFSRREKYVPPATQNMDMRLRLLAIGNEDSLFHSFQTDISTYRLGQKT